MHLYILCIWLTAKVESRSQMWLFVKAYTILIPALHMFVETRSCSDCFLVIHIIVYEFLSTSPWKPASNSLGGCNINRVSMYKCNNSSKDIMKSGDRYKVWGTCFRSLGIPYCTQQSRNDTCAMCKCEYCWPLQMYMLSNNYQCSCTTQNVYEMPDKPSFLYGCVSVTYIL